MFRSLPKPDTHRYWQYDFPTHLTPRQKEVLLLIARGHTCSEIASILGISYFTVRGHFERAEIRLGARNRPHAVALAVARGDIQVELEEALAGLL